MSSPEAEASPTDDKPKKDKPGKQRDGASGKRSGKGKKADKPKGKDAKKAKPKKTQPKQPKAKQPKAKQPKAAPQATVDEGRGAARIEFESSLPIEEAVSYFEAIVRGLKQRSLRFQQGDHDVRLSAPEHIDIAVQAQTAADRDRVVFALSWPGVRAEELTIDSP